jgi:protein-tyrosine phosphatase
MTTSPARTTTFRMLFVCTGNLCRSPFAEILLRHLLRAGLGREQAERFTVSSAGTNAIAGLGMDPLSRAELAPWRLDNAAEEFVARRLDAATIRKADIVLTADRSHRSFVVRLEPSALRATFCIREWERLLRGTNLGTLPADPVECAQAIVAGAHLRRGTLSYASAADDAIPDPIGLPPSAHRAVAQMVTSAAQCTAELLASSTNCEVFGPRTTEDYLLRNESSRFGAHGSQASPW